MKRYMIIFFTSEPKPPEIFWAQDMQKLFERVVELAKSRAKFTINEVGECVGDFS